MQKPYEIELREVERVAFVFRGRQNRLSRLEWSQSTLTIDPSSGKFDLLD